MSQSSIMSIRDLIDTAFFDPDVNAVNFKLIQSILYLLARQLRILGRQVEVDISAVMRQNVPQTSLSVTEVKLNAPGGKKQKTESKIDQNKSLDKMKRDGKSALSVPKGAQSELTTSKTKAKGAREPSRVAVDSEGAKTSKKIKKKDVIVLPNEIEENQEVLLRIIDQRADSHEEPEREPLPMASATDIREESLLIIQRVPSSRASSTARSRSTSQGRIPRLSIVTQDEFAELEAAVRQLQAKFAVPGLPGFPGNAELMEKLREGASLTDAMSALQLSARLEAAENMLTRLIDIVTEVAVSTGVDIKAIEVGTNAIYGGSQAPPTPSRHAKAFAQPPPPPPQPMPSAAGGTASTFIKGVKDTDSEDSVEMPLPATSGTGMEQTGPKPVWITFEEFQAAMNELRGDIMKKSSALTQRNTTTAEAAIKNTRKLEIKLEEALNLGSRMADLEVEVSEYSEQINAMDTGLSSQMTKYQEQLTQMQHELETGLETMAEALINVGGDPIAVAEMNGRLTSLQNDLEYTTAIQKNLRDSQNQFSLDLQEIHKAIELLRETKSDREEVEDAFRDKAGLGTLNGLVTREQFDAVRGDLEKRIRDAYDKFNSQEVVWQRAIDDLIRELNEKVDQVHMSALRDDINSNLNMLRSRIHALAEIVGEPRAFALAKKINREAECLSCATPANMSLEVPGLQAALPSHPEPRKGGVGAEAASMPKDSGDHNKPCYPGQPITHIRDPRAHYCNRYCGGSHTRLPGAPSRLPPDMVVTHCERTVATCVGTDGKTYMVDEHFEKVPCAQCNPTGCTLTPRREEEANMPVEAANTVPAAENYSQAPGDIDTLMDFQLLPRRPSGSGDDGFATPPFTAES